MSKARLEQIARAIERQEGFYKVGSRARRNKNPGNIKMGKFARLHGAVDKDDQGHAIFPTITAGRLALRALLASKFRGQTLRQIGTKYAEDPKWAVRVAKIAGVDLNEVVA